MKLSTREIALVSLFTALIAIGAFIRIPLPYVAVTLQLFFTTMAGILLGPKLGPLSVGLYVGIGLIGIPVFTQGGGLGYILKPTFGYLLAFILGTYITARISYAARWPSFARLVLAAFAGLALVYAIGTIYVYIINTVYLGNAMSLRTLLWACIVIPLPGDVLLSFIAAYLGVRLGPYLGRRSGLAQSQY